jgi:hypothetical protein
MLWTLWHEWSLPLEPYLPLTATGTGDWGILMIQGNKGIGAFLFSKEGVTQGDPISMFIYGLGLLPLIRQLKAEFPIIQQIWYADNAGAGGKFNAIQAIPYN